jgi:hypothetical protein
MEIRLVNALEEALRKSPTLWKTFDTLTSFKFLYHRPLFSSVINASADRVRDTFPLSVQLAVYVLQLEHQLGLLAIKVSVRH